MNRRSAPAKRQGRREVRRARVAPASDIAHTVTLHAIRPGVVDDYGSVWMADAFDESLARRLPALAWAHDWAQPIGRGIDYATSSDGPAITFAFDDFEDVPAARRAWSQVRSGTITDCSVGFSRVTRRPPTDDELRRWPGAKEIILKADLDEVSLVLRGAVPGAEVLSVRHGPAQNRRMLARALLEGRISGSQYRSGNVDVGRLRTQADVADELDLAEMLDRW